MLGSKVQESSFKNVIYEIECEVYENVCNYIWTPDIFTAEWEGCIFVQSICII